MNLQLIQHLADDATSCDLLVLRMCYGIYNSPSPSYFLRAETSGKASYEPHEYWSVTLTSLIASGATGVIHGATLKLLGAGGKPHEIPVVVKFAMEEKQKKSLSHEYSIYKRLAPSRIQGIPRAFGLFKDHGSDVVALVMTHVGTALVTLHEEDPIIVKEPQRFFVLFLWLDFVC